MSFRAKFHSNRFESLCRLLQPLRVTQWHCDGETCFIGPIYDHLKVN